MAKEADEIKGLYFSVLDHGFVALKDYMGGDEDVVEAARCSYGHGTKKSSDDRGLLRYLMRHYHSTPFEMVELKFHMKLPIFVARQLIRHRTANVNEYSGRYSLMPMLFYTPKPEQFSLQSAANRQGRGDQAALDLYNDTVAKWQETRGILADNYEYLAQEGLARELARIDLPLSMYTEWYWKLDLHNIFHFLRLRSDSHAQWEIRQFSDVIAGMVQRVAPLAFEAWLDYRYHAANMSRMELNLLGDVLRGKFGQLLVDEKAAALRGLSKREWEEFSNKLDQMHKTVEPRDFNLDPLKAKPAQFFYEEAQAAVPKIDSQKSEP